MSQTITAKQVMQRKADRIQEAATWYANREPEKTDLLAIVSIGRQFGLKPDAAMAAIKLSRKLRTERKA